MNNLQSLFSATLCVPLRLSLKLSFYFLFVFSSLITFTLLQSVGYPTNPSLFFKTFFYLKINPSVSFLTHEKP